MLIFCSLVRNSVVLAVYLLFSVACFLTVHEHSARVQSQIFYYSINPKNIEGRALKSFTAALNMQVHMSAKWPILRQPLHLIESETTHLLNAIENYALNHSDIKHIQTDQPVEFEKDLWDQVNDLYSNFKKDPATFFEYLKFSKQFYEYSARNQAMIYRQNPHATFVVSKQRWDQLKYSILPEHINRFMTIFRPAERSLFERNGEMIPLSQASLQEKAKIANKELPVVHKTIFVKMKVYDISQTNCPVEEYPSVYSKGFADAKHDQLYNAVVQVAELEGIQVTVEDVTSISLGGYYNKHSNCIVISDKENDTRKAIVMLHEYAHALLHNTSAPTLPKEVKEFEAQTLAVRLMQHYGFPIPNNEQEYIVSYLTKACQCPSFEIDRSLDRMAKQFNHAAERISAQLEVFQQKQQQQKLAQSMQQTVSQGIHVSENFLRDL